MLSVVNMKNVLIIVLCLLTVNLFAAEAVRWYSGVVVLRSNEVLTGELSLEPAYDLVLFRCEEKVTVYRAHKILSVYYYDGKAGINRKFTSIQQTASGITSCRLFEIVVQGEISVLRRAAQASFVSEDDAEGYRYYFQSGDQVAGIRQFRTRLFSRLLQSSKMLRQYMYEKKLSPASTADIILIIDFYNRHQPAANAIARHNQ